MKQFKKIFIRVWVLSAAVFLIIPLCNLMVKGTKTSFEKPLELFNTDWVEGQRNYLFLRAGMSIDNRNIVIGKQGWIFLGEVSANTWTMNKEFVDSKVRSRYLENAINVIQQRQDWLALRGIKSIFAIAPDKHSIYGEHHPKWVVTRYSGFTDEFFTKAKAAGINILDLRSELLEKKKGGDLLFFKTDSHWNHLGAAIGYLKIISEINQTLGLKIESVKIKSFQPISSRSSEFSRILKIKKAIPGYYDSDFLIHYDGDSDIICDQNIDPDKLILQGECVEGLNRELLTIEQPKLTKNSNALNAMNVLWLTDSFGFYNSPLFQKTFRKTIQVHYDTVIGNRLKYLVIKEAIDLVIYQVVERMLWSPGFQQEFSPLRDITMEYEDVKLLPSDLIFSLVDNRIPVGINFRMIRDDSQGQLILDVNIQDPILTLPKLDVEVDSPYLIEFEMESPRNTLMMFFYKLMGDPEFELERSIRKPVKIGVNKFYFVVKGEILRKRLRLDPTSDPGQYILKKFRVYKLPPESYGMY